jgi:hypothetical protein
MDNTMGKSIGHESDVIIIDDDTYDEPEPTDPEDRNVLDSSDDPPVPEDIRAAAKYPVDTADEDPEKLWKEWTKNQETQREKSENKTREFKEETKFKAKINVIEQKNDPEPKRARFIEVVGHDGDTIRMRQVIKEEDPVKTVRHFIAAEKSALEWTVRYQARHSLLSISRLPQMK